MGAPVTVEMLKRELERQPQSSELSFDFAVDAKGNLLVCRRGHWRGIWHVSEAVLAWVPAGSREPVYEASDVAEAVAYAIENILLD